MSDAPRFVVAPPIRCFHTWGDRAARVCAAPARWERISRGLGDGGYYCDEHRRIGDFPIRAQPIIRRVSVSLEVLFAATSWNTSQAHAEALARLERAVEEAGGVINLHAMNSVMGRCASPPPAGRPIGMRANP